MVMAFLALGANLGNPRSQIIQAIQALNAQSLTVLRRARLYQSEPIGPEGQPPYVNTLVEVRTELSPQAVLHTVKGIERELGRTQGVRWGPRLIDIDITTYGDLQIQEPDLIIPHAQLIHRAFVLAPLVDLNPHFVPPGQRQSVQLLLNNVEKDARTLQILEDWVLSGEDAQRGYR